MPAVATLPSVSGERRIEGSANDCDHGEFSRSLMRGLADRKAGRMISLSDLKAEFGIR